MVQSQSNQKNKRVLFDGHDQQRTKTLSVDFGGKEFFAAGNGHIAAVVVRMIAAIATHEHNPRLPLTIQSLKIPKKEGV
jgi:hypothetical protein